MLPVTEFGRDRMSAAPAIQSLNALYAQRANPQWGRQVCGNNFLVLQVAPPPVVTEAQIGEFVEAIRETVHLAHHSTAFWNEASGLARRAVNV